VTGSVGEWLMNGSTIISSGAVTTVNGTAIAPDASWHIVSINDFAGTTAGSQNLGSADIFWRNDSGAVAEWIMNGTQVWRSFSLDNPDSSWSVQNKPTNFA
jgi:hypothetical protein